MSGSTIGIVFIVVIVVLGLALWLAMVARGAGRGLVQGGQHVGGGRSVAPHRTGAGRRREPADDGERGRGLTTAASIWVTAAVGSAADAGLLVLAALTTGIYFVVTLVLPIARRHLPLAAAGDLDAARALPRRARHLAPGAERGDPAMVAVTMHVHGRRPVTELASVLTELDQVDAVVATSYQPADE